MSHIPLAILYSSFTKSFLLFLLTIWRPSLSLPGNGPYRFDTAYKNPWILGALEIWDEDKLDREWVVRNVLGGLAAGFGLRGISLSPSHNRPRLAYSECTHSRVGLSSRVHNHGHSCWMGGQDCCRRASQRLGWCGSTGWGGLVSVQHSMT